MTKLKKGFTLVELVIVIAVIAILASVLIPTFAGILERAKESISKQEATSARDEFLSDNEITVDKLEGYVIVIDDNCYIVGQNGELSGPVKGTIDNLKESTGLNYTIMDTSSNYSIYQPGDNTDDTDDDIDDFDDTDDFDYTVASIFVDGQTYSWNEAISLGYITVNGTTLRSARWTIEKIVIDNSITAIGSSAFNGSKVSKVIIPETVTDIGNSAFYGASAIVDLELPDSVKTIGNDVFYNCSNLVSIKMPASLDSIGSSAFYNCASLRSITIYGSSSLKTIPSNMFRYCSSIASIELPNTITTIDSSAFSNCISLVDFKNSSSLKTINSSAFSDCYSLMEITIPSTVTSIASNAFTNCHKLVHIRKLSSSVSFSSATSYGMPNNPGREVITSAAGEFANTLATVDNKYIILTNASNNDKYLIALKDYQTNINDIPENVNKIYKYAFYNQKYLVSAVINENIVEIGASAFGSCNKIFQIRNLSQLNVAAGSFGITSGILNFEVKTGSDPFTGTISYNGKYIIATYPEDVYLVGFTDLNETDARDIPNNVTKLYPYAFYMQNRFASVKLPETLTTIGKYAFYLCGSLKSVKIPANVITLEQAPFGRCAGLASVTFAENSKLKTIGFECFNNCISLQSIVIPASVTGSISSYAFGNCKSLESVIFEPNSAVTTLSSNCFDSCSSLTTIVLSDNLYEIREYAFEGCSSLTSITIPESVNAIYWAFSRGPALTEAIFEETEGWQYSGYTFKRSLVTEAELEEMQNDGNYSIWESYEYEGLYYYDGNYYYYDEYDGKIYDCHYVEYDERYDPSIDFSHTSTTISEITEEFELLYDCNYMVNQTVEFDASDSSAAADFLNQNEQYVLSR